MVQLICVVTFNLKVRQFEKIKIDNLLMKSNAAHCFPRYSTSEAPILELNFVWMKPR